MIIKGKFTSVWDDNVHISTDATLNTETGELDVTSVDVEGLDYLEREYFTDENNNEYAVCDECHCYIMKSAMVEGIGKELTEIQICSDNECFSNQQLN